MGSKENLLSFILNKGEFGGLTNGAVKPTVLMWRRIKPGEFGALLQSFIMSTDIVLGDISGELGKLVARVILLFS